LNQEKELKKRNDDRYLYNWQREEANERR